MFGHTFELVVVLVVGLLIFGPKRVIEMAAQAGKMLRELRGAVKEMNWGTLLSDEHGNDPLAELRDLPKTFTAPFTESYSVTPTTPPDVPPTTVESAPPPAQQRTDTPAEV
ncbi:MAG: twin-arginine translocase TatA/TatE family subunit [Ktedonobacterales bacterium]